MEERKERGEGRACNFSYLIGNIRQFCRFVLTTMVFYSPILNLCSGTHLVMIVNLRTHIHKHYGVVNMEWAEKSVLNSVQD